MLICTLGCAVDFFAAVLSYMRTSVIDRLYAIFRGGFDERGCGESTHS
ncbi:hypothetical protein RSSM_00226 [Rhodopirellula sallentina SM41]|uniref:Uncharacterized protein n=1 Tax=Rhodopirellula sallentina SM41 TaxID=1263870 RepID=M5UAL1_9BACT|nr:hypothetical protein RSSM_00226 [Rhodopirellula sallentina SM41]